MPDGFPRRRCCSRNLYRLLHRVPLRCWAKGVRPSGRFLLRLSKIYVRLECSVVRGIPSCSLLLYIRLDHPKPFASLSYHRRHALHAAERHRDYPQPLLRVFCDSVAQHGADCGSGQPTLFHRPLCRYHCYSCRRCRSVFSHECVLSLSFPLLVIFSPVASMCLVLRRRWHRVFTATAVGKVSQ